MLVGTKTRGPLIGCLLSIALIVGAAADDRPEKGGASQAAAAQGVVENVQSVIRGGVVIVTYDLVADPRAVFTVVLDVSRDGGATFDLRAKSVSGDVGPGIRPGTRKQIRWEATQDVERLDLDNFRYRVVLEGPPPETGVTPSARPSAGLSVTSIPSGAHILVDGSSRGQTPLKLDGLTPGDHRVTLTMEGYLENSRTVRVEAGSTYTLELTLTPEGQRSAAAKPSAGGGGGLKWVLIGGAGAGAAIAAAAAGGGGGGGGGGTPPPPPPPPATNRAPSISSVTVSPDTTTTTGIDSITQFTLSAQASDPDNDPLSYSWNLGDGTTQSGQTVTKTYTRGGNFDVVVTVTDGRGGSVSSTPRTIRVASVTGTWRGTQGPSELGQFSFTLTQNGTTITGTYTDSLFGAGQIDPAQPGRIDANRNVELRTKQAQFTDFTFRGTLSPSGTQITGGVFGSGFNGQSFTITKQ